MYPILPGLDSHSVNASLHGHACILHVAPYVREDLGLEAELADGLAVLLGLLGRGRRRELDIVYSEFVESLRTVFEEEANG